MSYLYQKIDFILNNIITDIYTKMAMQTPEDYISYLTTNNITITLINIVKELNKLCENIDISFIDDLLGLVGKSEICISHELLIKYGVLNTTRSNDVIKMLNKHKAVENKDYNLRQVAQVRKNRGTVLILFLVIYMI